MDIVPYGDSKVLTFHETRWKIEMNPRHNVVTPTDQFSNRIDLEKI